MPSLSRRSPRRYPPKVECPEPKRDGQSLAYTADSSPDLVRSPPECPEQQVGDDESLQSPPRRLYCPVPNLCLRDFGAEERTRTFTLLARCLRVLVPKKGLEPSRCLRVAFEFWCRRKDSNLHAACALPSSFGAEERTRTFTLLARCLRDFGAEERTRTFTPLRVHGPEPCASANSATSAHYNQTPTRICRVKS